MNAAPAPANATASTSTASPNAAVPMPPGMNMSAPNAPKMGGGARRGTRKARKGRKGTRKQRGGQNAMMETTNNANKNNAPANNQTGGAMKAVGSKAQVWHGTARHTSGGLTKKDLMKTKNGRIVSKRKHALGKKALKRLVKAGFKAKKGTFKLFRK